MAGVFLLGIVDLSNFTWPQFWIGVAYILSTGLLSSLGVLRLFQERIRQGVILLIAAVVITVVFFSVVIDLVYR